MHTMTTALREKMDDMKTELTDKMNSMKTELTDRINAAKVPTILWVVGITVVQLIARDFFK